MLLTRLEPHEAIDAWPSIYRGLHPAIERNEEETAGALFDDLVANAAGCWVAHGFAGWGVIVTRTTSDPKCLWIVYATGAAKSGSVQYLRDAMALFEGAARSAGCEELRLKGRKGWQRVFPDFEVLNKGFHVELRKVL